MLSLLYYNRKHENVRLECKKEYHAVHNTPIFLFLSLKKVSYQDQVGFKIYKYTTSVINAKNATAR